MTRRSAAARRWTGVSRTVPAVMVGALALAGCTGSDPLSTQPAEDYFTAVHESWGTGFTNLAQFSDPGGAMDLHCGIGEAGEAATVIQLLRRDWRGDSLTVSADEPVYLSADGAVDPSRFSGGGILVPQAPVYTFASGGRIAMMLWTGSLAAGAYYVGLDRDPLDARITQYVAGWSGAGREGLDDLYAPTATLTDSLLGVDLVGRQAIVDAADSGPVGLLGASMHEIPEDGGTAAYHCGNRETGEFALPGVQVILLEAPGADGCPGPVAVVLTLDANGLITHEERYHRVDAVERCFDANEVPDVWWDDAPVPDPGAFVQTGTVWADQANVTLWNGTPDRERLLTWALARFSENWLPTPGLHSVTFAPPDPDPWSDYGFVHGAPDVVLPSTGPGCPDAGCETWPAEQRVEALTALAHTWLADPARRGVREEYASTTELPWDAPDATRPSFPLTPATLAYAPLGAAAHRAAHVLVWGLMDEPSALPDDVADLSCDQLAADFLLLTGSAPTTATCPESTG